MDFYTITALDSLGPLGSAPPLTPAELLQAVGSDSRAGRIVEAILLSDDLLQREAVLSGESDQPEPSVLTVAQLRDEQPLPDELAEPSAGRSAPRIATDGVWSAYFHHAAEVARQTGSTFLAEWVEYEVSLRNALATARARALDLEPGDYLVASDLAYPPQGFSSTLSEWSSAPDPMTGQRALDRARWQWLQSHDAWFTFSDDELAAYAAKLLLLHRWHRIGQAAESAPAGAQDSDQEE
jgi:hypothetical protein